jgi:SAM-dependent methyltransferase
MPTARLHSLNFLFADLVSEHALAWILRVGNNPPLAARRSAARPQRAHCMRQAERHSASCEGTDMHHQDPLFTDGEAYERLMGRWSRVAGESFLDWLGVPKGLRWLDVGCGNGAFTQVVIARCAPAAVTGLDPSPEQVAYALERTAADGTSFQLGDAHALPFADSSFDIAAMALVLAFLNEPAKAVAEMARVVRPGGWAATYMWDVYGGGVPIHPLYAGMKAMGLSVVLPPNPEASGLEPMREFWRKAGLESVETSVIRIPIHFDDFEDFWTSVSLPVGPQGKYIQRMPPHQREELRTHVRKQLPIAADGSIAYEAIANAVKGRMPR